jgi:hypothetical protein
MRVVNTEGEGVTLRDQPGTGERIKVWPEGTELTSLGETQQAANRLWTRVRDPEGTVGWVASEFLLDSTIAILTPTVDRPAPPPVAIVIDTPVPAPVPTVAVAAQPTATFPALRPTFTPQTAAAPAAVGATQSPAQAKPGSTAAAPAKPGAASAPPAKPGPTQPPSKPSGQAAPAKPADRSAPQGGQCPGGQPIKANAATGAYYVPGSPGYASAAPDDCFQHEQAAQGAGYSRSR